MGVETVFVWMDVGSEVFDHIVQICPAVAIGNSSHSLLYGGYQGGKRGFAVILRLGWVFCNSGGFDGVCRDCGQILLLLQNVANGIFDAGYGCLK